MTQKLTIHELMNLPDRPPFLDVRTPAEFTHGHMPGAFNLPLFSNEERVQVGTTYKQKNREAAILLGFDLAGPKWSGFIRQALEIAPEKKVVVHCWRGGMRSGAMAWALDLYGFKVFLVEGGYKAYRRWVQQSFAKTWDLRIVGGMTGSGKTRLLHALREMGEQVIDLEDIAQHCGSTYGTLNRLIQPSQEQFENNLAENLQGLDQHRRIWLEDESITIGRNMIPKPLWTQMLSALLFCLQVPLDQRVATLVMEYGSLDKDFLVECTDRIRKRLGFEQTKYAIAAIREGRLADFIRLVLVYYDKTYHKGLLSRDAKLAMDVPVPGADAKHDAQILLNAAKKSIWI